MAGADKKRIGMPSPRKESTGDSPVAPSLLGQPTAKNLHPSTGFVHCAIKRVGSRYHLSFQTEDAETVSIIAEKIKTSRTANYRLFDALRGGMNAKLSKKSGHYLGKLRQAKDQSGAYTLFNCSREKRSVAAYQYDVPALMEQVREGQPPREMQAIVPKDGKPSSDNRLLEHLHNGIWKQQKLVTVKTRAPTFAEGQYRLNLSGRVLLPSVKNMQLETSGGECLLQFGRVDENTFHLDYKAPFTAFSAFGAALCQFDL
ncbi:hypothetical protein ACHAXT_011647 [Thalassiosira profunda]